MNNLSTLSIVAISLFSLTFTSGACAKQTLPTGYRIDTIATPSDIPFHITGLDIDQSGKVAVATRLGDVWFYSNGQWAKFADGLHEPTGLLIEADNTVVVGQKPELSRIVDTNNDGVADEYIKVADDWTFHDNYHEFNFAPVKDAEGNFFGTLNLGHGVKDALSFGVMDSAGGYRGWAYKVTPSGEFVPYASGLRSPAGVGLSPKGELFVTDNQGDWVASSKLHLIRKGEFYGHPVSLRDDPNYTVEQLRKITPEELEPIRTKPNVWFPHKEISGSPGNPEWDTTEGKFGPFTGQIFVGDQTLSNVFRVMLEEVNGEYQGAAMNFIDGFQSGNIRVKFDPEGALWVGQTARGWQSEGNKPFGLQKVVWDGTTPFELLTINLIPKGFDLSFTQKLDKNSIKASDITVSSWRYRYHHNYGSPKVDLREEKVLSSELLSDQKLRINLFLEADRVYAINFPQISNQNGAKPSTTTLFYTLNSLKSAIE